MISAISPKGHLRFMTFDGKMNGSKFIEFLERLIDKSDKPIFLILDGHPVHKSKQVSAFVEGTQGRLRLFILPPYSPHLNPDEWVWNWLKNHNIGKTRIVGPDPFRASIKKHVHKLQKSTDILKGFFQG